MKFIIALIIVLSIIFGSIVYNCTQQITVLSEFQFSETGITTVECIYSSQIRTNMMLLSKRFVPITKTVNNYGTQKVQVKRMHYKNTLKNGNIEYVYSDEILSYISNCKG